MPEVGGRWWVGGGVGDGEGRNMDRDWRGIKQSEWFRKCPPGPGPNHEASVGRNSVKEICGPRSTKHRQSYACDCCSVCEPSISTASCLSKITAAEGSSSLDLKQIYSLE